MIAQTVAEGLRQSLVGSSSPLRLERAGGVPDPPEASHRQGLRHARRHDVALLSNMRVGPLFRAVEEKIYLNFHQVGEDFFRDAATEASLRLSPRSPSRRLAGRSMTSTRRRGSPRSTRRCAGMLTARAGTRVRFFAFRLRVVETYIASSGRVRGTNASGPSRSSARLMSTSVSMQQKTEQGTRQDETIGA